MKFFVLSRGDQTSNQLQKELEQKLHTHGFVLDEQEPDIVMSVGGDGTLLEAFHHYLHRLDQTAFIGIHTGRLGFYADWRPKEMDQLVDLMVHQQMKAVSYPVLEVEVEHEDGHRSHYLALNESTIKTTVGSLVMNIEINGDHFETFRGDGLCISTPSGSTAYNKSLGGAIVHPSLSSIQLAEMASINNRVYRTIGSPLLLPDHHTCLLKPQNNVDYQVTIDHITVIEKNVKHMLIKVAEQKVRFARYRSFPFWKRVRESFIDST